MTNDRSNKFLPMAPSHPPNTPSPHSPITSHWPHPNFPTSIFFLPPATIRPKGADIHHSSIIIHHSEMPAGLLFTTHQSPFTTHQKLKRGLIFFSGYGKNISYPGKPAMLNVLKPESESQKGVRSGPRGGSTFETRSRCNERKFVTGQAINFLRANQIKKNE
jgi:hypothetical protein